MSATTPVRNFNNNALFSIISLFRPDLGLASKVVVNRLSDLHPSAAPMVPVPKLYTTSSGTGSWAVIRFIIRLHARGSGSGIPFGGPQNFAQLYEDVSHVNGKHISGRGAAFEYLRDNRTFGAYETAASISAPTRTGLTTAPGRDTGQGSRMAVNPQGKLPGSSVSLPLGQPNFQPELRYKESAPLRAGCLEGCSQATLNLGTALRLWRAADKNPALESTSSPVEMRFNTPQGLRGRERPTGRSEPGGWLLAPDKGLPLLAWICVGCHRNGKDHRCAGGTGTVTSATSAT